MAQQIQGEMAADASGASPRVVLSRRSENIGGVGVTLAQEDVRALTDWSFEEPSHVFVVHLAGRLSSMESVFARGPSGRVLPQVGDLWVIPAGCRYSALAQGDTVRFAEFTVPGGLIGGRDVAPRIGQRDPFLHQLAARLDAVMGHEDDLSRMLLASLVETTRLHLAHAYGAAREQRRAAPQLTAHQRRLLEACVCDRLEARQSLDELAALVGMSVHELLVAFRAAFGMTPRQYVIARRLAEAKRLLATTGLPLTTVALSVGFSTPSHFSTTFRQHEGVSPSAYRRLFGR
ncbi:AraC family transcriptional regulator [Bosea sp. 117]|uniref:helix-turn-helix transcriptional regulator n=1 Tax=Bosea sp. 117 TaxID=1125973 RepID=UPI0006903810|nr:AraC family transcriptional regulator [Bosea sp. 117]